MTLPLRAASGRSRNGRRIAGAAFFLLLLVQATAEPARAQPADPFSATVRVDARADTASKARETARVEGQRRALVAIAERLSGGASVQPPKLDDRTITDLVASFEVANERMSAVRYVAEYTFHFRPAETRRALGVAAEAGAAGSPPKPDTVKPDVAEPVAKRTVILPVYQATGQTVLWDDPNPWREAWEHAPAASERVVVPLGDAGDLAAIDAEKARAGDTDAIAAIARRNGGGEEAVVAVAVLRGSSDRPGGVDVRLRRYRGGRLVDTRGEGFAANPGESAVDLLRRAVAAIAPDIGAVREPEPPPAEIAREREQTLTAVLPIDSLEDWLRARERLQAVPAIRKITVAALSRQEATIAIDYTGTIEQLKSELAKISLDLVQRESRWRLARDGAGGAP
ncbi:MAG: DUF2066 domain-containing protein [Alphaproteobacteria bacterium]